MTYALNILDLLFTLHAIANGATELNPLMRSVPVMVAWKVLGVGILCWVLKSLAKQSRTALWGLRICTAVYAAVDLYHIYSISGGAFYE